MRRSYTVLPFTLAALLFCLLTFEASAQTSAPDHKTISRTPANPALPSLWIVGDSTADQSIDRLHEGFSGVQGWGVLLPAFFEASRINVIDVARGGRSSRTFITEGFWDTALNSIKSGDIVLIQLGQNDVFAINDDSRARGTIQGTGAETQEISNLVTHKLEIVHTFGWYIRKIVEDARAKGATPVVMSLTPANTWRDGHIEVGVSHYREWSRTIATEEKVAFVDVSAILAGQFEKFGKEKTFGLYHGKEPIHMNFGGAFVAAACVLAGLKGLPNLPIDGYLTELGHLIPDAATLALPTLPPPQKP